MTQSRQLGAVLMGLAVLAALVTWLMSHRAPMESAVTTSPMPRRPAALTETPGVEKQVATGSGAPTRDAPVACPDQSLEVAANERPKLSCVGRTRAAQNGSVRTYRVEAQDRAGASLTVDAAGDSILRAELTYGDGITFSCLRDKCGGISVGPHDAQGARSLRFNGAKLTHAEDTALVSATLRTVPDDQMPATSCVGQLLYISVGEGTLHFCPDSGTGFQVEGGGILAYKFINGDGSTLAVRVDQHGALQSVEYGTFSCRAPSCAGTNVSAAAADGQRNFTFQGTVLTEQGAGASTALLNGNLVLAPQ